MIYYKRNNINYAAELEDTHKNISDSINYAKRLQDAIIPSLSEVNKYIPNNFIFYKPKNVVSGDFYWIEQIDGCSYFAAADCTGHGVPGAMVSVVCSNALNRSVKEFGITEPSKILDKTRELVIETFNKNGEDVKDGMDIALCAFKGNKVIYAGANNPLWIVRKTELLTNEQKENSSTLEQNEFSLIEHKANKQPVGVHLNMKDFTQEEILLHPSDSVYLFTDGYPDQFGGEKGKKFKYKPFKSMLIDLQTTPIKEQGQLVANHFDKWKGDLEQVDDVCVIGLQFIKKQTLDTPTIANLQAVQLN
jgi:serine phosphatase RsbU (regulator of sigma subunit)